MITFIKKPPITLDLKNKKFVGFPEPQKPVNVGIPTEELHKQVMDLIAKKIPLEKALKAVDSHPDITDKPRAKMMVQAVYKILEPTDSKKNPSRS